jgi:hypothetical protein
MGRRTLQVVAAVLIGSLAAAGAPAHAAEPPVQGGQSTGTATIEGRVFGADRATPIPGAVVRAVRGDGVQVYSSLPADEKGNFRLTHIVPGSYDLVVELADGVFVVERTMAITGARTYHISLATVPADSVTKKVPAIDKPVQGYAWTLEGKKRGAGGFWRTPGGIVILSTGGAGLIALLLDSDDNKGSNSTP